MTNDMKLYEEYKAKVKNIVENPIREFKKDALRGVLERYESNHPKSKEIYDRMLKSIPGGVEHSQPRFGLAA
ncbi:MAG: hypothetical protein ACTSR8_14625 [Promethearchaeota archaeon]